jgi:hypothetical protein
MEFSKRLWIGIVILAACARLLPHPWNFTPIIAIGLFAGNQARSVYTGILVTLSALVVSDAVLADWLETAMAWGRSSRRLSALVFRSS